MFRTFSRYPFEAGYNTPSKSNTSVVFFSNHQEEEEEDDDDDDENENENDDDDDDDFLVPWRWCGGVYYSWRRDTFYLRTDRQTDKQTDLSLIHIFEPTRPY